MCIERSLIQKRASFNPSRHHKSAGFECVRVCIQKAFIARYIGALVHPYPTILPAQIGGVGDVF